MKQTESPKSSERSKRKYEIVMDMIIQLLEAGLEEYEVIYDRVRVYLEIDEPKLTQSQWGGRWSDAIEKLKEDNRISVIPKRIRLIEYPREEEILKSIEYLKMIDNQDIVEIGLQRLSQLSESGNVAFYSSLLDALGLIIKRNYVYNNYKIILYLLRAINTVLYYNYANEPKGYKDIITRVDNMIGYFYSKIHPEMSQELLYNTVESFPRYTSSETALKALFYLIECLDDTKYNQLRFNLGAILYNNEYKVSKIYSRYIEEELKKLILKGDDKTKERARHIMSLKIQHINI